jgi:parallel beta-helix repeat protein
MSVLLPEPALTIKSDGTIDPSTAPIRRDGGIYTLTDNVTGYTIIIDCDNVTLDGAGYTLRGPGYTHVKKYLEHLNVGVYLLNQQRVTVRNMRISGFYNGISISVIFGGPSSDNRLEGNVVSECYYGICMYHSSFTVLRNNRLQNNIRNLFVQSFDSQGMPHQTYTNDIDSSNKVDGKPVIYWTNKQGLTVPADAGYVILVNCTNMTLQNLNLQNNGEGMALISTANCLIRKNSITGTDVAINVYNCSHLVITENNLEGNNRCVDAVDSSDINVSSNSMTQGWGGTRFLGSSSSNVAYDNDIKLPQETQPTELPLIFTATTGASVAAVVAAGALVYWKKRKCTGGVSRDSRVHIFNFNVDLVCHNMSSWYCGYGKEKFQ